MSTKTKLITKTNMMSFKNSDDKDVDVPPFYVFLITFTSLLLYMFMYSLIYNNQPNQKQNKIDTTYLQNERKVPNNFNNSKEADGLGTKPDELKDMSNGFLDNTYR